jgi:hypothetical protein
MIRFLRDKVEKLSGKPASPGRASSVHSLAEADIGDGGEEGSQEVVSPKLDKLE